MIIEHAAGTLDQFCEAFPAMRSGVRIVHPGVKSGGIVDRNIN
jgi:hypothetical protein